LERFLTVQSELAGSASDALILRCTVAALASRMTRRAVVVLGLIRIWWTRSVALVLMHHQMMLATGTFVRPVLTAGAIGLARHARAILCVYVEKKQRILLDLLLEIVVIGKEKEGLSGKEVLLSRSIDGR